MTSMRSVLGVPLPPVPAHELAAVALAGVLALSVVGLAVYALVARRLRDAPPADRPEILRALAELVASLRGGGSRRTLERRSRAGQHADAAEGRSGAAVVRTSSWSPGVGRSRRR
jgi:hypothetical protein